MTCAQALQSSTFAQRAGAWVLPLRNVTTVQGQPAGICGFKLSIEVQLPTCGRAGTRVLKIVLLQSSKNTVLSRPRHQPTETRVAETVASCQESAPGRQAYHSQQRSACVVELSLCPHNSLSTVAPAVAAYWDTAKNGVTPDQIMAHSGARRHWLCPKCGHSWQAGISAKVRSRSKCPKCSSVNRPRNRQPSLTQSQHPAMLEFDFQRNRRAGLDPDKITAGSNKIVHWICTKCPKGQPHLYVASPQTRISCNAGCPYCASKKACACNSLQSLYPALAAEYDTAKNGDGPEQVLSGSVKMAFWKDATGHTWEQSPYQRTAPDKLRRKIAFVKSRFKSSGQLFNPLLNKSYSTEGRHGDAAWTDLPCGTYSGILPSTVGTSQSVTTVDHLELPKLRAKAVYLIPKVRLQ
ncbi:MAG: hypothetical protein FRX49_09705 [Trebouxia sp. A1-2]|nr:MAG: hypothetical protein FRX49_09705 [Trebouxia sp. A1-2]